MTIFPRHPLHLYSPRMYNFPPLFPFYFFGIWLLGDWFTSSHHYTLYITSITFFTTQTPEAPGDTLACTLYMTAPLIRTGDGITHHTFSAPHSPSLTQSLSLHISLIYQLGASRVFVSRCEYEVVLLVKYFVYKNLYIGFGEKKEA